MSKEVEKTCKAKGWVFKCKNTIGDNDDYCILHNPHKPVTRGIFLELKKEKKEFEGTIFGGDFTGEDFSGLKLVEADFRKAELRRAKFEGSDLWRAKFDGVKMSEADLRSSMLMETSFRGATLTDSNLERSFLKATNFSRAGMRGVLLKGAHFDNTVFDNCIWDERGVNRYEQDSHWDDAKEVYQNVKSACLKQGDKTSAGRFFYREMEMKRKQSSSVLLSAYLGISKTVWGYGEKPYRLFMPVVLAIVIFGSVYWKFGGLSEPGFLPSLYFSAVSFSCLGYGPWITSAEVWVRFLGVVEAMLGVVSLALFASSLFRQMDR